MLASYINNKINHLFIYDIPLMGLLKYKPSYIEINNMDGQFEVSVTYTDNNHIILEGFVNGVRDMAIDFELNDNSQPTSTTFIIYEDDCDKSVIVTNYTYNEECLKKSEKIIGDHTETITYKSKNGILSSWSDNNFKTYNKFTCFDDNSLSINFVDENKIEIVDSLYKFNGPDIIGYINHVTDIDMIYMYNDGKLNRIDWKCDGIDCHAIIKCEN